MSGQKVSSPEIGTRPSPRSLGSTEEAQMLEAVEEYRAAMQDGRAISREEFLRRYPAIAPSLSAALDGLEFIEQVAPQLSSGGATPAGSSVINPTAALGDFRIVRQLGRGGMGVVYEAEQLSLGRRVALKVLPFAAMLDEKQLKRFQNEAKAAATLTHPNIVQVYSVGTERGVHYYAMQLIEGQSMAEVIDELRRANAEDKPIRAATVRERERRTQPKEPRSQGAEESSGREREASEAPAEPQGEARGHREGEAPAEPWGERPASWLDPTIESGKHGAAEDGFTIGGDAALADTARAVQTALSTTGSNRTPEFFRSVARLGIQAAEALDHAHQQGIVHRDVKPANLMLDARGNLSVTDFGLAQIESDAGMTMTGDLIGTMRYMSPEQALAKRVVIDHRTDVYSLGVTIYELLTLQPAYDGNDRQALFKQIAFDEPKAPRRINDRIPHELETIVLKAMAKNPEERYATAQELADDLRRYLQHEPIKARRPSLLGLSSKWLKRHHAVVITGSLVAATSLLLGTVLVWNAYQREKFQKQIANQNATHAREQEKAAKDASNRAILEAKRSQDNLDMAFAALDEICIRIGGRLLPEDQTALAFVNSRNQPRLSDSDRQLLQLGLSFYDAFIAMNQSNTAARSQRAKSYLRAANLLARAERYAEARPLYKTGLEQLELSSERYWSIHAHVDLADIAEKEGRFQEAKANWLKALSHADSAEPPSSFSEYWRGMCHWHLGELAREQDDVFETVRQYRKSIDIHKAAHQADQEGMYFDSKSASYQESLADRLQQFGAFLMQIGHANESREVYAETIPVLRTWLEIEPKSVMAQARLINCLKMSAGENAALQALDKMSVGDLEPLIRANLLAIVHAQQGDLEKARRSHAEAQLLALQRGWAPIQITHAAAKAAEGTTDNSSTPAPVSLTVLVPPNGKVWPSGTHFRWTDILKEIALPVVREDGWSLQRVVVAAGAHGLAYSSADGALYFGRWDTEDDFFGGLYRIDAGAQGQWIAKAPAVTSVASDHKGRTFFWVQGQGLRFHQDKVMRLSGPGMDGTELWVSEAIKGARSARVVGTIAPSDHRSTILKPSDGILVVEGTPSRILRFSTEHPEDTESLYLDESNELQLIEDVVVTPNAVYLVDAWRKDPDDGRIYRLNEDRTLTRLVTTEPIRLPAGITADPLTGDLVVAEGWNDPERGRISRVDPATGKVTDVISHVAGSTCGVRFSPDGSKLFVTARWTAIFCYENEQRLKQEQHGTHE